MTDTGRIIAFPNGIEIEIDSDVLVTEQRMIDTGQISPKDAKILAPQMVDVALNAICPCCSGDEA